LIDILDAELQDERGLSLRWYDVLVQLEEAGGSSRMTELAGRILASKSGLTRVVDRMEEAGLVRRERPADDRRVILVCITPAGLEALQVARAVHRRGIQEHFVQHLDVRDLAALERLFRKVSAHVRPLRPGRVSG
jgi:DNA-binding MarR family transcriptional regulator